MELKNRKLIANGALPKFDFGTTVINSAASGLNMDLLNGIASGNNSTGIPALASGNGGVPTVMLSNPSNVKPMSALGNTNMAGFFEHSGSKQNPAVVAAPKRSAGNFLKNNASGIMNIASTGIDFFSTFGDISKNKITSDQMMGSGGLTSESANGISYQQSKVDEAGISNQIDATAKAGTMAAMGKGAALGGAIGSVIPGLGTVAGGAIGGAIGGIAGLFGSSKAKEEAKRQKRIAVNRTIASNTLNREMAYTTGLRDEFNRENKTGISQSLFHAALGVEGAVNPITRETYKKHIVNTKYGKIKTNQNAWVSDEEVIGNKNDGYLYKVRGGKNDTARAYLEPGDSVYSKKVINPETGNPVADDAPVYAAMGMLDRLDMNLNVGRMMKYAGKRKGDNVLPGYLGGTGFWGKAWKTIGNGIKDVRDAVNQFGNTVDIGNIASLGNAYLTAAQRDARAEGLRAPKSFVANPYEQDALQQLNNLHSDYYPVWAMNRELEGRGKSSIAQSGGLAAGQKMLGYMGLTNQTQQNNMTALFEHQGRENALRAQAAKASLEAGNQTATRQQQAYQWDEDMLAKAHAAQDNMFETSAYDRQNGLTQFFKNLWEKNQFDRTMNLYESQQKDDHAKTQAIINSLSTKQSPEVEKATIAPQTVATMQKLWNRNPNTVDLGELELPEFAVTPAKKVAKPKVTKRRTVKRGGKK